MSAGSRSIGKLRLFVSATGLNHNYFRNYDPCTGRYIESDPMGLLAGINTYAYADANPLMLIDPLGLAACGTPDRCAQLRKQIFAKAALLIKELLKYNPIEDAKGGFPMKWGFTTPGGHYQEITDLQRGLKNDITEYKRLCSNNRNWPSVPRAIDDAANRDVEQPIITTAPGISVPNSSPNLIAPAAGLGILGGLAVLGFLAL